MKKILTLIFAITVFCCQTCYATETNNVLSASATYTLEKKDPKIIQIAQIKSIPTKEFSQKVSKDNLDYQKYKKHLKQDPYDLAVILEKLIRANNLQYQTWRFGMNLDPEDINAQSSAVNLIIINSALYDCLQENKDALAFVMAHELAHLLLKHQQITLENSYNINRLQQQINAYSYITKDPATNAANVASVAVLTNQINKIYEQERLLEKEADIEAITLMTKAGYDPKKANDTLEFLAEIPNIYTKRSTHPLPSIRLSYVNEEIGILDLEELKAQGKNNLYKQPVTEIKKSSDRKTVVFFPVKNCPATTYTPESKENKLIKKGYKCYLNNDFENAKFYFKQAYSQNKKNYIPALYLSYINEYEFKQQPSAETFKKVKFWTKKAVKANSGNLYVTQQKEDIIKLAKSLKEQKQKEQNL